MNVQGVNVHPEGLPSGRFVVVTTGNLPEAWFLVSHLLERGREVAVLNAYGRPLRNQVTVLRRLRRDHGLGYVVGLLAARIFRSRYQAPEHVPFPEIDAETIARMHATVPVHETDDLHDRRALAFLRSMEPDYILVAGAPVLRRELYTIPRFGALNRHPGISPLYRGSDCPIWTLAAGDFDHVGYTIHRVSSRVDGGEVLLQRRVQLVPGEDFGQAMARITRAGSEGFAEVIDAIIDGHVLPGIEQEKIGQHYPPAPLGVIRRAHDRYLDAVKHRRPAAT
ncbi:formyl transferase [Halofilum ochraceum]|uniref:formyl transferase n=1 Tax=Halofilum ochraceum TaxID=1611323 RepID=UPI000829BE7F|nr:formyl transferase [Halofilum ochraceum]